MPQRSRAEPRQQVAALPLRWIANERIEVMLVTSRETRRWVLPKGWLQVGSTPSDAAAVEAWEEAGVRGDTSTRASGTFDYLKRKPDVDVPVTVTVYPMRVAEVADEWPEMGERSRAWFTPAAAAAAVDEPDLKRLLLALAP